MSDSSGLHYMCIRKRTTVDDIETMKPGMPELLLAELLADCSWQCSQTAGAVLSSALQAWGCDKSQCHFRV